MPTRIIRDGILDSDKYAQLSESARLLFIHLLLLADDFGCVNVGATFLRRRAFFDNPGNERIAKLVLELVDVDMIRTYEVDRGCYAFIPKFKQRLDRMRNTNPVPEITLYKDDEDALKKFECLGKNTNQINKETPVLVNQPTRTDSNRLDWLPEEKRREEKRREVVEGNSVARPRGTRLQPDWMPSEDQLRFAKGERPDLDLKTVADSFRDYWVARAGKEASKLDWNATWRNWVRNQRAGKPVLVTPAPTIDWKGSRTGIEARGAELGIHPTDPKFNHWQEFRTAVMKAAA